MFIYELNNYIKSDTTLQTLAGGPFEPRPMVGYENDQPPILLYYWMPSIKSAEAYYINVDIVKYIVLDTDFDRCLLMSTRIIKMLNKADDIQVAGTGFTNFIPKWSILLNGQSYEPIEREGFYHFETNWQIGYVPIA